VPATAVAALVGVTAGLLVVLLLGGTLTLPWAGGDEGDPTTASAPGVTDPAPVPGGAVLPVAAPPAPPEPSAAGLAAALAPVLGADVLGPRVGLAVLDEASGRTLYATDADLAQVPASTAKIVTGASALRLLGPDARIPTTVVAGTAADEVVLVGGGDVTITRDGDAEGFPTTASMADLARQTAEALEEAGTTRVRLVLDDTAFTGPDTGPGWLPGDLAVGVVSRVSALTVDEARVEPGGLARYADPTARAGVVFRNLLRRNGVTVTETSRGAATAGAARLGIVESAPVSALVEQMLLESDNDLAEALAHLAGAAAGAGGSFAGGAIAAQEALDWLGIDATGAVISDGSGLSTRNRYSAELLAAVLEAATSPERPELAPLVSGLPAAGVDGTLSDRFDTPTTREARGRVRAKTGTLTGVHSLAGTVLDADGRTLVFAVLADETSADSLAARAALDRVPAVLESCGCP
jgi:D-alanyl-D-alanine carboxypeptidase/D-alanyl-D-alanine-endopeptidase (penicillin-binding protein 4)